MDLGVVSFVQGPRPALMRFVVAFALFAAAGLAHEGPAAAAPMETVLYSFKGATDGADPVAGLIFDTHGALYGTTELGGIVNQNHGTVFKLTPSAAEIVLYRFKGGTDGDQPVAGVVFDTSGALYGTTTAGGASNFGTVFKLTPPVPPATNWTERVLYSFKGGTDGFAPHAGLIFDSKGALYGTTLGAGSVVSGSTVFKLTPPVLPATNWNKTVLYSFKGGTDGFAPYAGLIFDTSGALYGTTSHGGAVPPAPQGNGTVFKLTPPAAGKTQWTEKVLYRFKGGTDGGVPVAGLIFDAKGALYGTGYSLGSVGTVFKLTPPAAGKTLWTEKVLYTSKGRPDGERLDAGLIFDTNGALYSTTYYGGASGEGTVFKLTPPVPPATNWTEKVLYSFAVNGDGHNPAASLILDASGVLYGTTFAGGKTTNAGAVFKLKQ